MLMENNLNLKLKGIHCDNGTKFKNASLNYLCSKKGVIRQYSSAWKPQHIGVAERIKRTLIEAARTMLCDSKMSLFFWVEAVNTACDVQNWVLINKSQMKFHMRLSIVTSPQLHISEVYNKSTKQILESYDVHWLEENETDARVGPDWLFDYNELFKPFNVLTVIDTEISVDATVDAKKEDLHVVSHISPVLDDGLSESPDVSPFLYIN
ncbi:uncharacterized protein LOC143599256 [Bidens hawaiensis]|uniref:uncharacterized protein LOC143599256 n=1 Tax=Bidens hawaiensis TaxID=980011 RepID=UPI004049761B